jgi:hypothetical protein
MIFNASVPQSNLRDFGPAARLQNFDASHDKAAVATSSLGRQIPEGTLSKLNIAAPKVMNDVTRAIVEKMPVPLLIVRRCSGPRSIGTERQ